MRADVEFGEALDVQVPVLSPLLSVESQPALGTVLSLQSAQWPRLCP